MPWGSTRNVKVHPGSSDPPSNWNTWEEYLQLKPGEFTPDQIVAEIAQNRLKIDRTVVQVRVRTVRETADVTPIDTPKKSEEAKLKNDPDGSSCQRVDKSPRGSAGEGPPKPSSKLK